MQGADSARKCRSIEVSSALGEGLGSFSLDYALGSVKVWCELLPGFAALRTLKDDPVLDFHEKQPATTMWMCILVFHRILESFLGLVPSLTITPYSGSRLPGSIPLKRGVGGQMAMNDS